MRIICKISTLLLLAAVIAAGLWFAMPKGDTVLKSETAISIEALKKLTPSPLIIDARGEDDFSIVHIDGALNLSLDDWEAGIDVVLMAWEPEQTIVVYCGKASCSDSYEVVKRLRNDYQMKQTFHLKGGWEAWLKHAQ